MKFKVRKTSWTYYSKDLLISPCLNAFKNDDGSWAVEIKDLQELVDFVKDNGEIVLYEDGDEIEIYDDYRE